LEQTSSKKVRSYISLTFEIALLFPDTAHKFSVSMKTSFVQTKRVVLQERDNCENIYSDATEISMTYKRRKKVSFSFGYIVVKLYDAYIVHCSEHDTLNVGDQPTHNSKLPLAWVS
jgi:hypothetical protein